MEKEITLHDRLVAIQSELKAPKGQYNSFGKYKYRSAEDILEAVKPLLKKYGCKLTIMDEIVLVGDRYYVKAIPTISDGTQSLSVCGWAREAETKTGMDASQITGTASSYARKYALNGLFAIDDTKDADTDENHVETEARTKAEKPAPKKAPKPQCPEDVWYKLVKMEVEGLRTKSGLSPLQFLASKYHVDDLTLVKFSNDVQMARDSIEANEMKEG